MLQVRTPFSGIAAKDCELSLVGFAPLLPVTLTAVTAVAIDS